MIVAKLVIVVVMTAAVGMTMVMPIMRLACHFLGRATSMTIAVEMIMGWAKIAIIVTFVEVVPSATPALEVIILAVVFLIFARIGMFRI